MTVRAEARGHILVVAIHREEKANAIDDATAAQLDAAFDRLEGDPGLWVAILTGTSTVFSAGTDLANGRTPTTERGGEYGFIRRVRSTPVIAAVEGYALGGGCELAMACDLVVASREARFGLPETRRGLVASAGGLLRASHALPPKVATELLITGGFLDGPRAYQLGLVNRLCDPGRALDEAVRVAHEICASSPFAVAQTLAALRAIRAPAEEAGWRESDRVVDAVRASADAREGIGAFLEKREPRWSGH